MTHGAAGALFTCILGSIICVMRVTWDGLLNYSRVWSATNRYPTSSPFFLSHCTLPITMFTPTKLVALLSAALSVSALPFTAIQPKAVAYTGQGT